MHEAIVRQKNHQGEGQRVPYALGQSLRRILEDADLSVRSGCLGNGACGLCRVRIIAGEVSPPSPAEWLHLDEDSMARGVRLACQTRPLGDVEVENLSPAPQPVWKRLEAIPRTMTKKSGNGRPGALPNSYGLAVDFGTTHIRVALHELASGRWLTGRSGLNPQLRYGADVLSRLAAASQSPQQAKALQQAGLGAVGCALRDIFERDGLDTSQVARVLLVGNTAMLCLLANRNHEQLLKPENWGSTLDCAPLDCSEWKALWGLRDEATVELAPPVRGFVGSDLSAGVLAVRLMKQQPGSVFIDCGTNSEIALWDGRDLWVTAAAGGPAFEGSGMSCGMPAEAGAIYSVQWSNNGPNLQVLPGKGASGLCGSGLVDLLACLLDAGLLQQTGRFVAEVPASGYVFSDAPKLLRLRKSDVDLAQRAKAAIAAGLQTLLQAAGVGRQDLTKVMVAGAFGRFLNVPNARRIGLLPESLHAEVMLCGDTALAGCEECLLSPEAFEGLNTLPGQVRHVNLGEHEGFEDLLLENLYLRPMSGA